MNTNEQKHQIADEEIKNEIYKAARHYSTRHVDPIYVSRHHFVSGAYWAFSNDLIQRFINQSVDKVGVRQELSDMKKAKVAKLYEYFKMRDGLKEGTPAYQAYDSIVCDLRDDIDQLAALLQY